MDDICGIYQIKNIVNGKVYIGSSKRIGSRWKDHIRMLNNNKHHSLHLQSAWNMYGPDNFEFSVLEKCSVDEIFKREQYYIDKTKCYDMEYGYNIMRTAGEYDRVQTDINNSIAHKNKPKLNQLTPQARHTEEQVKRIINLLLDNKLSCAKIAELENVNEQIVKNILYKHNWKYLTYEIEFPKREGKKKDSRAKLTDEDVVNICELLMSGETSRSVAEKYGVTYQAIDKIREHKNFKYITEKYDFPPSVGSGTRKLTRDDVVDILKMSKNGCTVTQIMDKYTNIKSRSTITNILANSTWKEIDRNSI